MERKINIESEVNKTLDAMKNMVELEPDAYFYTRLMAEINSGRNEIQSISKRFGLIFTLSGIIILNLLSLFVGSIETRDTSTRKEVISQLVNEYSFEYKSEF